MIPLLLILFSLLASPVEADVGTCHRSTPPPSWLNTSGHGLPEWATAGVPPTGPNFCLQGNRTAATLEVDYHIDLGNTSIGKEKHMHSVVLPGFDDNNTQNACIDRNSSIRYCAPFCQDDKLQEIIIRAALSSSAEVQKVADKIFADYGSPAATAVTVDLNADPQAQIIQQVFLNPAWCSVYIGIHLTGFPYLYECQVAKILMGTP